MISNASAADIIDESLPIPEPAAAGRNVQPLTRSLNFPVLRTRRNRGTGKATSRKSLSNTSVSTAGRSSRPRTQPPESRALTSWHGKGTGSWSSRSRGTRPTRTLVALKQVNPNPRTPPRRPDTGCGGAAHRRIGKTRSSPGRGGDRVSGVRYVPIAGRPHICVAGRHEGWGVPGV